MTDNITIIERICIALDELKEIHGTEYLTYEIVRSTNKPWVRSQLRILEDAGAIHVQHSSGGRGKKTIIRRNRNSPGYPSRRDKHRRQIP